MKYADAVVDLIVSRCAVGETGARQLIGFIEQAIQPQLARLWLTALSGKQDVAAVAIGLSGTGPGELTYDIEYRSGQGHAEPGNAEAGPA